MRSVHLCIFAGIRCPHFVGYAHARSLISTLSASHSYFAFVPKGRLTTHFTSLLFIPCSYHPLQNNTSRASPRIVFLSPAPLFCMACSWSLPRVFRGAVNSLCISESKCTTRRDLCAGGRVITWQCLGCIRSLISGPQQPRDFARMYYCSRGYITETWHVIFGHPKFRHLRPLTAAH